MNNSKSGFTPILFVIMIVIITGIIFANYVISTREKWIEKREKWIEKREKRIEKRFNEKVLTDKEGRYLTINNETEQVIKDVRVTLETGAEIESLGKKNPDEPSFTVEIPKYLKEEDVFIVSFTDEYGMKYEKEVRVPKAGRTAVELTEDDHVKRSGDFKRNIYKFKGETVKFFKGE